MSVRCLRSLIIVLMVVLIGAVSGNNNNVKVGGEVSFTPNPILTSGNTITWMFKDNNGNMIRVVEFKHNKDATPQNPLFKDNTLADKNTGQLTLRDLTIKHSGLYSFEINNKPQAEKFPLKVMEGVPTPQLKIEPTNHPDNAMYLVCEYNTSIIWTCDEIILQGSPLNDHRQGESLVFENSRNPDFCCTCTLKNEVSEETSQPLCKRDLFPGESNIALILGILFVILILILIGVFIALYMCWNYFHGLVRETFGKTPCLGAVLDCLDGCRNIEPQQGDKPADLTTVYAEVNKDKEKKEEEDPLKGSQHD